MITSRVQSAVSRLLIGLLLVTAVVWQAQPPSRAAAGSMADIVFMVDESGSMADDQAQVRARLGDLADELVAQGIDLQLGLIGYSNVARVRTPLTSDIDAFRAATALLNTSGGGTEAGFRAVTRAMADDMNHREEAGTCAIIITDEDADVVNPDGTKAAALAALQSREATFLGIVNPTFGTTRTDYGPDPGSLAAETGGAVFNILAFRQDAGPVFEAVLDSCLEAVGVTAPPVADAGPDQTVLEGSVVTLDGTGSFDPAEEPLSYRWEVVGQDGPPAVLSSSTSPTPSFQALDDGTYVFRLTVSDGIAEDSDEVTVHVTNVAPALTALADPAYADGVALVTAEFTDVGWLDTHTGLIDFGDGSDPVDVPISAAGAGWGSLFGTHVYDHPGSYTVTLTVTDDDGGVATATTTLDVLEGSALWANSETARTALDWTAGAVTVDGLTHSNNDLRVRGQNKVFRGTTEYVTTLDVGNGASFDPDPVQVDPRDFPLRFDLDDYRPGGDAAVEAGASYLDVSDQCDNSGTWHVVGTQLTSGIYYADCDVKLTGSPLGGTITVAAEGSIEVAGTGATFDPFHDGLLFLSGSAADRAIRVSASNSTFLGYLFTEAGRIQVSGADNRFFCGLLGDRVDLSSTRVSIRGTGCVRPARTAVPPTLVPDLSIDLTSSADEVVPGDQLRHTLTVSHDGATLLVAGVVGAENLGDEPVTVTGHALGLEVLAPGADVWTAAPGSTTLTARPNPADGVTYADADADPITGTTIAPGSLASWGFQLVTELDPDELIELLDPTTTAAVRNVADLTLDRADVPVRQLFRFGHDLGDQLRDLGGAVDDVEIQLLSPQHDPELVTADDDPALARLEPGTTVSLERVTDVAVPAARGDEESVAAYLTRLAFADGSLLRAAAIATGSGGIGRLVAPQQLTTSTTTLPRLTLAADGPASVEAGDDATWQLALTNGGRADAHELVADGELEPLGALTLDGVPALLASGAAATATGSATIPADTTIRDVEARGTVSWQDRNGNAYGPIDDHVSTRILAQLGLRVLKTGERSVTDGGREAVQYQVTIDNTGDHPATDVVVTDRIGPYTQLVDGSLLVTDGEVVSGNSSDDDEVRVDIGTIPARGSVAMRYQVTIVRPLPEGVAEVANQATVESAELDPILSDDPTRPGADDPTITPVTPDAPGTPPGDPTDPTDPTGPGGPGGPGGPDLPRPTIGAVSPPDAQVVSAPIDIRAGFTPPPGETIERWRVTARRVGSDRVIELGAGEGDPSGDPESDGLLGPLTMEILAAATETSDADDAPVLAELDPTVLANGTYLVTVSAVASGGGTQTAVSTVIVDGNLKFGRVVTTYQDLVVPVAGLPIEVRRTYDSFDDRRGDFGIGWNLELANIEVSRNRPLGYLGWRQVIKNCSLIFCQVHYESDVPHVVTVTWPDGNQELFDLTPGVGSTFFRMLTTAGFTGRPGTTSTLKVAGDNSLAYLDDGNLYGGPFGIDGIFDPKRFELTAKDGTVYLLDRDRGVVRITDRNGEVTSISSNGITSSTGPQVTFTRDPQGRITEIEAPGDITLAYGYDPAGDLVSFTDADGNTTTYEYEDHRLVGTDGPDGGRLATYTYDNGRLVAVTDALGNTSTIDIDRDGRTETVTSADGRLTTIATFDDRGNVVRVDEAFDGRTVTTTFEYDAHDRRTSRTDPLGRTWSATYDGAGNVTAVTEPTGAVTRLTYGAFGAPTEIVDAENGVTRLEYDSRGNLTRAVDATDRETTFGYVGGRQVSRTDAAGTTSWTYDEMGRIAAATDPNGGVISFEYDDAGRPVAVTDALDATTTLTYDGRGNLTGVTDPEGGVSAWTYDDRGRVTTAVDPEGATSAYAYDPLDRLLSVTDPTTRTTSLSYDPVGNLTGITDPAGESMSFGYDGAGRLVSMTDATGRRIDHEVDAAGRVVESTDAAGRTWTYAYDDADRLTEQRSPLGTVDRFAYDGVGRLVEALDGLGHPTLLAYDAAGRVLSSTDPTGSTTRYDYDAAGRLQTLTDALDGTIDYHYDPAGQVVGITDPLGRDRTFAYDEAGNLTSATDPATGTSTFAWDAAGRLVTRTDARGVEVGFVYDDAGRLTRVDTPDGPIVHGYDAAGRRRSMVDATGTTTIAYDTAGRVASVDAPAGQVSYGYDTAGRRTSLVHPDGATVTYGYDTGGDLVSIADPTAGLVTLGYDGDGRLATLARPNAVVTSYTYDAAGRLTGTTDQGPSGTLATFTSELDAAGNRVAATGPGGTTRYTLDALHRLVGIEEPGGGTTAYTYDAAGNRLSETAAGTTTTYGYDPATGRLTSVGGAAYGYDAAGNVTSAGDDRYRWDWDGRLVEATVDGVTTTSTYDGDGVRVGRDATPQHWDRLASWPLLIGDGSTRLLHAAGPAAAIAGSDATWLHTDPLGSVRALTDASGSVIGSAAFDPFGNRTITGAASVFGFGGEQHDPTGQVFLRARTLDPTTGRFTSADPVQPNAPGTQGYHRYSYVANNPTTWLDPTGHVTLIEYATLASRAAVVGAIIGAGIGWWLCPEGDIGCIINEAIAGAIGGLIVPIPGMSTLGRLGAAGLSGMAGSAASQALGGGGVDPWRTLAGGATAAGVSGLLSRVAPAISRKLGDLFNSRPPANTGPGGVRPVNQGQAGVDRTIADLEASGGRVLGREITVDTAAGRTRPDIFAELPNGQQVFIEVKTGPGARLNPNQSGAFPEIINQGGTPVGGNAAAAGLTPGQPIGPTQVWVVHQPWPLPPP